MDIKKPNVIYVLGGPGSGKGTQCKAILDGHPGHFFHISTGALLRQATEKPTPENAEIIECMKQGKMVPSKPLVELILQKIRQVGDKVTYLLDGFPRNQQNLQAWKEVMKDFVDVKFLLYFECTEDEMRKRLLERAKTSGRADDNPETIEKRINIFNFETKKMLDKYKHEGGKLVKANADQSIENVTKQVNSILANHDIIEKLKSKPKVLYVLGGPGSGKGTQCKAILDGHPGHFFHISTGALLRQATEKPTPENAEIIECMKQGKMVPSKPLVELILQKIRQVGDKVTYLLDGFPRNQQNLQAWKEVMKDFVDVKFLLYFECTEDEMRKRLLERAKTSGRADDNPETIEKRINIFNFETKKMLDKYKHEGGKLIPVNANHSIESVSHEVKIVLKYFKLG